MICSLNRLAKDLIRGAEMKNIPTAREAEALRAMYREAYGNTSYEYQKDMLDWLEFRLLNDAYEEKFGDYVGNMCNTRPMEELNTYIRQCLESGVPYDDCVPEGAVI